MTFEIEKYHKYSKGPLWYIFFVSILAFFTYRSYLTHDYVQIFLFFLLVVGMTVYILIPSKKVNVEIDADKDYFIIGEHKIYYVNFRGFYGFEDPEVLSVNFFPVSKFRPTIKLCFNHEQKDAALKVLFSIGEKLPFLKEETEPTIDYYQRLLRF